MKPNVLIELMYTQSTDNNFIKSTVAAYMMCKHTTVTEAFDIIDNILEKYNRVMNDDRYDTVDIKALKLLQYNGGYIDGEELLRLRSDPVYLNLFEEYRNSYDYESANERYTIAISDHGKESMSLESDYRIIIHLSTKCIIYFLCDSYSEEEYNSKFYDNIGVTLPEYEEIWKMNMDFPKIPFSKWELAKQKIALHKYMVSDDRVLVRPIYK